MNPHKLLAVAALLAAVFPDLAGAAENKGRWINDGLGRAARDGRGSACISSGGADHAFAREDCDAAAARRGAPAPEGVVDLIESRPAAPAAAGGTPETGKAAPAASEAPPAGAPVPAAAPAAAATVEGGATAAAAVPSAAEGGSEAAAAAAAGAAALAGADTDEPADTDEEPETIAAEEAEGEDDTVAGASGDSAPAGEDAGSPAPDDPAYAPGSVALEDREPGVAPPAEGRRESAPVVDNTVPEFPVTKYTAPGAADAPKPAAAREVVRRSISVDKAGLFDSGSAALRPGFIPELDEIAGILKSAKNYGKVTVTGHTDRMGSVATNKRLSERRARAVRDYLVAKGIDPARIVAVGKGPAVPVTAAGQCDALKGNALRACLAPDRRVEVEATATGEEVTTVR